MCRLKMNDSTDKHIIYQLTETRHKWWNDEQWWMSNDANWYAIFDYLNEDYNSLSNIVDTRNMFKVQTLVHADSLFTYLHVKLILLLKLSNSSDLCLVFELAYWVSITNFGLNHRFYRASSNYALTFRAFFFFLLTWWPSLRRISIFLKPEIWATNPKRMPSIDKYDNCASSLRPWYESRFLHCTGLPTHLAITYQTTPLTWSTYCTMHRIADRIISTDCPSSARAFQFPMKWI